MNINIFLFLLIIIIVFTEELYFNIEHVMHYFSFNKYSDIPTLPHMIKKIYTFLDSITKNKLKRYTFIDIGCGDGNLLSNLCKNNMFNKCVGIEINKKSYVKAKNKCKNIKNLYIYNSDALSFKYEQQPTIFYLYEPFFDIEYNKSIQMYNNLLKNISNIKRNDVYVIYVTGRCLFGRKDITKEMFKRNNFKVIKQQTIGSIFIKRKLYIAKHI